LAMPLPPVIDVTLLMRLFTAPRKAGLRAGFLSG
jgi:hypothetical protein